MWLKWDTFRILKPYLFVILKTKYVTVHTSFSVAVTEQQRPERWTYNFYLNNNFLFLA